MADAVERPGQIRVEHPQSLRARALDDLIDRFDRVVAATAGPKPVGPRLEPRLPLGLQRVDDPCLVAPVERSRESLMGAACGSRLGDVHPPDRQGLERLACIWCTLSASLALASGVSTTSPSTPAVRRPALRSVTRRTLKSVFARERSINFCSLRTLFRSPAFDAVKIRCRNRRTLVLDPPPIDRRQSKGASSGPFTAHPAVAASNLSSGSGVFGHLPLHRLT